MTKLYDLFFKKNIVSGTVERVGAVGFGETVYYMTLLLYGSNKIYRIFFNENDDSNLIASVTQSGDVVEFEISDYEMIKIKNFQNVTLNERMKQPESIIVKDF